LIKLVSLLITKTTSIELERNPIAATSTNGNSNGGGGGGTSSTASARAQPLSSLVRHWDYSWINQLTPEFDMKLPQENKSMRPVFNGHYVHVNPTPLKNPRLVAYSPDVAHDLLQLSEEDVKSDEFARFFSGDVKVAAAKAGGSDSDGGGNVPQTWATPYALSIMGTRYTSNCPYGTGDGYGDGPAVSVGEVLLPKNPQSDDVDAKIDESEGVRLEMQPGLQTP